MNFKNLMLFLALGLVMTFASCDKEDIVADNSAKLVGTWNIATIASTGCTDDDENGTQTFACEDLLGIEVCTEMTIVFAAAGTLTYAVSASADGVVVDSDSGTGTWEIIDATRMTLCQDGDCDDATYTLTDTRMTVTSTDAEDGCTDVITANK